MSLVIKTWSDGDSDEAPAFYTRFDCHVGMTYEKQIMQLVAKKKKNQKINYVYVPCKWRNFFFANFLQMIDWLKCYQLALHIINLHISRCIFNGIEEFREIPALISWQQSKNR